MSNDKSTYWKNTASAALTLILAALAILWAYEKMLTPTAPESNPRVESIPQPAMEKGLYVLSRAICETYDVPCGQAQRTLRILAEEAEQQGVDVALAVGLALQESQFRPTAKSRTGDHGLLQVNYRWHRSKVRRLADLYDVRVNARIGLSYLKSLLLRTGTTHAALRLYNGANGTGPYPEEVSQKAAWAAQFI